MKTFVIAQHHGVFLTLQSMHDCGIDDIVIIIPNSQVVKYNAMYSEKPNDSDIECFKDYDKRIKQFVQDKGIDAEIFIFDDFDIRNTAVSTLKFISAYGYKAIAACIMSGVIVIKDYRLNVKPELIGKTVGACYSRVYQNDRQLAMYAMLGLPQHDKAVDLNFFVVDSSKISESDLNASDGEFFSTLTKNKSLGHLSRQYNGKDDILIGTAISARQTIAHNLRIQDGCIVNLWNKSIKVNDLLKSEEIYGYPFNIYGKYAKLVGDNLPKTTVSKIVANGVETENCTSGLYECLDIIDL
jgi:hypothetical protein